MVGSGRCGIRVGILAAAALLSAGCSDSSGETTSVPSTTAPPATSTTVATTAPPTTTTTTTTVAPTSTTADPLARPDKLVSNFDRDSVDDFDTTGDDLYRIVLELDDLFNYLEGNPTGTGEQMVGQIFDRDYPFWDSLVGSFGELSANGWQYIDPGMETTAILVLEVRSNRATVRTTSRRGEQVITDSSGTEVRRISGWDLDIATYELSRGEDGQWRYSSVGHFESPSEEELASMVQVEWTGRSQ